MHCPLKSQFSLSRLKTEVWQQGPSFLPTERFLFFVFLSIYIFFIYYYCVCLCAMVHIWRTEDNSVEWALSFYLYMGSGDRVWRSGLVWQTSLPDEPSHQSTSLSFETILLCTWGCPWNSLCGLHWPQTCSNLLEGGGIHL